jgi:plastocyanin
MTRSTLLAVAALGALVLAAQTAAMAPPKLSGTVGPGFTITLKKGGKKVTKLTAEKYTITVADKSPIHNFVLQGPGLGKGKEITGVSFVGTKTATVTLKKGTYTFVCIPHKTTMKGTFKVS